MCVCVCVCVHVDIAWVVVHKRVLGLKGKVCEWLVDGCCKEQVSCDPGRRGNLNI